MGEKTKTLQEALNKLPEYTPGDDQWSRIEELLENYSKGTPVNKLGQFVPPDIIWQHIDQKLTSRARRSRITILVKWSIAAAAILVVGSIIFNTINTNDSKLKFNEIYLTGMDISDWQKDDAMINDALEQICAVKPDICLTEEFKALEKELEFLNQSKQSILDHMNPYDSGKDLELLLTKIELEQTSIINQLVVLIN